MEAQKAKSIFLHAVEHVARDKWPSYLADACRDDPTLRHGVESLLAAHQEDVDLADEARQACDNALPTIDQPVAEQAGAQIGPYKLLEQIGEGGFGLVYMAEQREPVSRKVALKIVKPGMDSNAVVNRFEAERQALAVMDHPNVAHVLDAGTTETGRPYFAMELVHGVAITEFCDHQKLPTDERLGLFTDVCRTVQHAHQKGVIHRDLKPSNVMITLHDDKPVVKVIDFGVAKALSGQLTEKTLFTAYGQMVGTPLYMSPEQAQMSGLDVDTRSDVYSLGVLLYELLTGATPFDQESLKAAGLDEMRRMIREEEPQRPSARLSTLNRQRLSTVCDRRRTEPTRLGRLLRGDMDWITMKCLEKDRNRRYESAASLAADIERYLQDEPVEAGPPSAAYCFSKFVRRNKGLLSAAAVVGMAFVLGVAGTTWQAIRATQAERATRTERDRALKAEQLARQRFTRAQAAERDARSQADQAKRAAADAQDQQQRAETNLQLALDALDNIYLRVAEEELAELPDLSQEDYEFLQAALPFYEELAKQKADDPQMQSVQARAYHRVGNVYALLRDKQPEAAQDAEAALTAAMDLYRELAVRSPDTFEHRYGLARAKWKLGNVLLHTGSPEKAEPLLRESLATLHELKDDLPPSQRYQIAYVSNLLGASMSWQGKFDAAEQVLRQGLSRAKQLVEEAPGVRMHHIRLGDALHQLAKTLESNGRIQEAEEMCRQSLEIFEDMENVAAYLAKNHVHLGRLLKEAGRIDEAKQHFRRATDFLEGSDRVWHRNLVASAHNNLGNILSEEGALEQAEKQHRKAIAVATSNVADNPGNRSASGHLADAWSGLADCLLQADRPQEAVASYDRVLELKPNAGWTWKRRGASHFRLGHYDQALVDLNKAVELNDLSSLFWISPSLVAKCPDAAFQEGMLALAGKAIELTDGSCKAYCARACIYAALKKYEKAQEDSTKAIALLEKLPADSPRSLRKRREKRREIGYLQNMLGNILQKNGQLEDAEKAYRHAIRLHKKLLAERPTNAEHSERLGWSRHNLTGLLAATGRWDDAATNRREAIELKPDDPLLQYWLALAQLGTRNVQGYRSSCAAMLDQFAETDDPDTAHWVAWTCLLAPQAVPDLSVPVALAGKAVAEEPEGGNYRNALGGILYRAGRFQEAIESLEGVVQSWEEEAGKPIRSSAAYTWYFLAMANHRLGHADEARRWLEKANAQADSELNDETDPPSWNRRLTLKLFRAEAEKLIHGEKQVSQSAGEPSKSSESPSPVIGAHLESIEAEPETVKWYTARGEIHARFGRLEQVAENYAKALELLPPASSLTDAPRRDIYRRLAAKEKLFDRVAKLRPDDTELWIERGRWYVLGKRWERALADYARVVESRPIGDEWHEYACLLLLNGQRDEYKRLCRLMRKRFGKRTGAYPKFFLARTCAMGADSSVEAARIVDWAQEAVAQNNDPAWFHHALGAALYRAGQFEEAFQRLEQSNAQSSWPAGPKAQNAFLLALAHHRLDDAEASRRWYERGLQEIGRKKAEGMHPPDWLGLHVLHREAKAVLEGQQPAVASKPPGRKNEDSPNPQARRLNNPAKKRDQNIMQAEDPAPVAADRPNHD